VLTNRNMANTAPHRYMIAVTVCTLLLVITGAIVTSNSAVAPVPLLLQQIHRAAAAVTGLLILGAAIRLSTISDRPWVSQLGWTAVALVVVEAALGILAPSAGFVHAVLAHVLFGVMVGIAVLTSPAWSRDGEIIEDRMRPPMNTLAPLALALVVVQVLLGAAVRHNLLGVLSHIGFALVVALALFVLGMCLLHHAPNHRVLHAGAITLMIVTGIQVFLGFTAFIVRLMAAETSPVRVISSITHVSVGALTLGSAVMVMLQVRRYVRGAVVHRETRPSPVS